MKGQKNKKDKRRNAIAKKSVDRESSCLQFKLTRGKKKGGNTLVHVGVGRPGGLSLQRDPQGLVREKKTTG